MSKEFGKNLKELRIIQGLYQKDIAEELNIAQVTVSSWERGNSEPTIDQIIRLCEILNTTPNELNGFENVKENKSELEKRLIKAGLKEKADRLSPKQYDTLISIIDNFKTDDE